jgi:hypothetical protein
MSPVTVYAMLFAGGIFVTMLLLVEAGRRLGKRHAARVGAESRAGLGLVDSAVYALLGLMIAFTFSAAFSRFDTRRNLIVQEANAIGTAYLRIDLLPADVQPRVRELFRRYLDSRLATYQKLPDVDAALKEYENTSRLQQEIWTEAVEGTREMASPAPAQLLLSALNEMIDITTTRLMATRLHQPTVVFAMLGILSLSAALLAGYGMASGKRSTIHNLLFATVVAVTIYLIIDLEYPRLGLIRVDEVDQVLHDLRGSMK